jgi:hypothetical protein
MREMLLRPRRTPQERRRRSGPWDDWGRPHWRRFYARCRRNLRRVSFLRAG